MDLELAIRAKEERISDLEAEVRYPKTRSPESFIQTLFQIILLLAIIYAIDVISQIIHV